MKKTKNRFLCLFLAFISLCPSCCVTVFAFSQNELNSLVLRHNTDIYNNQLSDDDAFYSFVLPSDRIDSDNTDVKNKAQSITKGCATDAQKIKAVHDWVAANIYYDMDYANGHTSATPIIASDVLYYKYSVCEGYANLSAALLRSVGVPAKTVIGYALTGAQEWTERVVLGEDSSLSNHKWNMAYADGRWIIFDTAWDSNNIKINGVAQTSDIIYQIYYDMTLETLSQRHKITELDENFVFYNLNTGLKYKLLDEGTVSVAGVINKNAKQVYIPGVVNGMAVSVIGWEAFRECHSLETVLIGREITRIGTQAFLDCTALKSIYIPSSVTQIDHMAIGWNFYNESDTVVIKSSTVTIYGEAGSKANSYAQEHSFTFVSGYFDITDSLYGNLDENSALNVSDARKILRAAVGLETLSVKQSLLADYNRNGVVEVLDARLVLRRAVGLS